MSCKGNSFPQKREYKYLHLELTHLTFSQDKNFVPLLL